jgi:hypothetical protein
MTEWMNCNDVEVLWIRLAPMQICPSKIPYWAAWLLSLLWHSGYEPPKPFMVQYFILSIFATLQACVTFANKICSYAYLSTLNKWRSAEWGFMIFVNERDIVFCFCRYSSPLPWARASSFTRILDHTQRHTTVCRTPLDEWSVRRRDLYLTTHTTLKTHKYQCPQRDSNPQSQQASGCTPTP